MEILKKIWVVIGCISVYIMNFIRSTFAAPIDAALITAMLYVLCTVIFKGPMIYLIGFVVICAFLLVAYFTKKK